MDFALLNVAIAVFVVVVLMKHLKLYQVQESIINFSVGIISTNNNFIINNLIFLWGGIGKKNEPSY